MSSRQSSDNVRRWTLQLQGRGYHAWLKNGDDLEPLKPVEVIEQDAYDRLLEASAERAYLADAEDHSIPWPDLEEWKRESWRCEVDASRDPDMIRQAAERERSDVRNSPNSGPRQDGKWCVSCGVWDNGKNGMQECPVSRVRMTALGAKKGLSHLWSYGTHDRAMRIWRDDANIRARSSFTNEAAGV